MGTLDGGIGGSAMDRAAGLADAARKRAGHCAGDADDLAAALGLLYEAERTAAGDQELLACWQVT